MAQIVELKDVEVVGGRLLVKQDGGKYDAAVERGRVFSQTTTPLGLAIPIYTATAPLGNVIWNPSNSGVIVKLLKYNFGRVSGTTAFAAFGVMVRKKVGADVATGSEITAFAETVPENGLIGGGQVSKVVSSNAGTVTVSAGVAAEYVHQIGTMLPEIDATASRSRVDEYDFDGLVQAGPGTLLWIAGTKASVALFSQTLMWEEVPIAA